jgi:hypothetical protein
MVHTGVGTPRDDRTERSVDELIALTLDSEDHSRWSEVLERLTTANRVQPSAAIERALLRARYRAAASGRDTPTHSRQVASLADPFPGRTGLPEVTPERLDAATLGGSILHHGALVVRGFADPSAARALRDAIDAALAAHDATSDARPDDGYYALETGPGSEDLAVARAFTHGLGGGLLAVDAPHAFFLWSELVERRGFTGIVAELLGERPVLSADKTTFRRLREAPGTSWHQDGSFMGDVRAMNLWVSLSHCGGSTDVRGLDVIPCRTEHLLEVGTHGAGAPVAAISSELVAASISTPPLTPEFEPGDALCFDGRFLHRTSAADVDGLRHAVEAWFFASSEVPVGYTPIRV